VSSAYVGKCVPCAKTGHTELGNNEVALMMIDEGNVSMKKYNHFKEEAQELHHFLMQVSGARSKTQTLNLGLTLWSTSSQRLQSVLC
jgi:hypothetical protein